VAGLLAPVEVDCKITALKADLEDAPVLEKEIPVTEPLPEKKPSTFRPRGGKGEILPVREREKNLCHKGRGLGRGRDVDGQRGVAVQKELPRFYGGRPGKVQARQGARVGLGGKMKPGAQAERRPCEDKKRGF